MKVTVIAKNLLFVWHLGMFSKNVQIVHNFSF